METPESKFLLKRIRMLIVLFMCGMILSGLTAFPIETELTFFEKHASLFPRWLADWFHTVFLAVTVTNDNYPFLSYGTDWLGFAHIVVAVAFIGPLKDPVKNSWVIQFGIISCFMVFPMAFIVGAVREIPVFWRLIDCAFGAGGMIPLFLCQHYIKKLEQLK